MATARFSVLAALIGLAAPAALVAQVTLRTVGFSITIEGQTQGVFPGGKGNAISGVRFSYALMSPRDPASGLATGKRRHTPVVFTKGVGTASTRIFSALAHNENLTTVVVTMPSDGGAGYKIKLTNANISEIKQYTEMVNGVATVLEDVSFTFQKIEVQDLGTGTIAVDDWEAPVS